MDIVSVVNKQREFFNTNTTKELGFRKEMLQKLFDAIKTNEAQIYSALKQDLNKSEFESYLAEISIVTNEIKNALKNLNKWAKPIKVKTPITHFPAKSVLYHEPYGVVLVLSPWNYPFQLALAPVVGAIAAGNCVVLKGSRNSKHTSNIIQKIIKDSFDESFVAYVDNDVDYDELLKQRYDYIFFTGSERIGKVVMRAASEFVTPVSLELGGKSPCFIDESADIAKTAKRIVWGKLLNAGQTCIAPDYFVVDSKVKVQLIQMIVAEIKLRYGNPLTNKNYPKIISKAHFDRLNGLISRGVNVIGGQSDERLNSIAPAIFDNVSFDDEIMQEEIFGPILPMISCDNLDEAIRTIKLRAKPLACYIFSNNKDIVKKILSEVSFGGGCVNDTIMHIANHHLPFGGVGSSGMGHYHGHFSFETFSHKKGVVHNVSAFDIPLRYAPYSESNLNIIKKIMK